MVKPKELTKEQMVEKFERMRIKRNARARKHYKKKNKNILKKNKIKKKSIDCECGGKYKHYQRKNHFKTKKHLNYYVRSKLGQDLVEEEKKIEVLNNYLINDVSSIISKLSCNIEDKSNHARIDMTACNSGCNHVIYQNNKKICDLFNDELDPFRLVIYVWKGSVCCYIIEKVDTENIDYWDEEHWSDGINEDLKLPYEYCKSYTGYGTIGILMDIMKKFCNYKNDLVKPEIFDYKNFKNRCRDWGCKNHCDHCGGTGMMYACEGLFMECLFC